MSLQKYLLDLYGFEKSLHEIISEIVKKNESTIIGLVKNRLYQHGVDGTGNLIEPEYKISTVLMKKEENKRSGFVTLRDEGLFYGGFYVEMQGYDLILNSTDGKTSSLVSKYGEAILHFTKEEQDFIFLTMIEPGIEDVINSLERNSESASGGLEMDFF